MTYLKLLGNAGNLLGTTCPPYPPPSILTATPLASADRNFPLISEYTVQSIDEIDGPPHWSLEASETGESTKYPCVGVGEGTGLLNPPTPTLVPTNILYSLQFRSHQETKIQDGGRSKLTEKWGNVNSLSCEWKILFTVISEICSLKNGLPQYSGLMLPDLRHGLNCFTFQVLHVEAILWNVEMLCLKPSGRRDEEGKLYNYLI